MIKRIMNRLGLRVPVWEHVPIPDPGPPGPVTYYYIIDGKAYVPMPGGRDVIAAIDWLEYAELKV